MAKGADPFLVTVEGLSILHVAVMRGADFVLRSILDNVKLRFGEESVSILLSFEIADITLIKCCFVTSAGVCVDKLRL